MADLIDRQAAIDAIPKGEADIFENCSRCTLLSQEEVVEILERLPSAEQVGRWELVDYLFGRYGGGIAFRCTNCGKSAYDKSNYCPNCGARMEKDEIH